MAVTPAHVRLVRLDGLHPLFVSSSVVSFILCAMVGVLAAAYGKHRREDAVLLYLSAIMAAVLNLRDIIGVFYQGRLHVIVLVNDLFLAMWLGVAVHLAARTAGHASKRAVLAGYAVGGVSAGLMLAAGVLRERLTFGGKGLSTTCSWRL